MEYPIMNKAKIITHLTFLLLTGCGDFSISSKAEIAEKKRIANEKTLAEVKSIVNSNTVSNIDKLRAIDRIRNFDQSQANELQNIVMTDVDKRVADNKKKLDKTIKQQAIENIRLSQIEKKRKKQEGVSIGMTMQDVLDSSWGRPQHKTTYHTAMGQHTIWQYGKYGERGTISFKDGIVDMIQN